MRSLFMTLILLGCAPQPPGPITLGELQQAAQAAESSALVVAQGDLVATKLVAARLYDLARGADRPEVSFDDFVRLMAGLQAVPAD